MTSSAHLTVNFVVCTTCLLMAAEKSEAVEPDTTNYGSVGRSNWAFIFDEESFPQSENDQKFVPTDFAGVPNLCRVNNQVRIFGSFPFATPLPTLQSMLNSYLVSLNSESLY